MLSTVDLERLIAVKRREIESEKTLLGLAPEIVDKKTAEADIKENSSKEDRPVRISTANILTGRNGSKQECARDKAPATKCDLEDIPADLERYIRRYLGLPVMLKAGEYSPNNPLIRAERATTGDALLGLGEYERRRNTLRKIRQRQYREYLDQQAKIKQEAKEKAEQERREREERERLLEERERERERESELERERYSPERRRGSVNYTQISGANNAYTTKVDTGVQVNNTSKPLSVAVQTDEEDLFRLSPTSKNLLTQAERELSPRTVVDSRDDRPIQPASWAPRDRDQCKDTGKHWKEPGKGWKGPSQPGQDWKDSGKDWKDLRRDIEGGKDWKESGRDWKGGEWNERKQERRRSYGDFDERARKASRDKASSETRTYKPSIFDADAIELRNLQAEKEATARRQFYQQELKNQILEQQRIREERKTREKMLEQAEMRRLEQQLRSLRAAQEREIDKRYDLNSKIRDDESEYDRKRTTLQKEIDLEHQSLQRASQSTVKRTSHTSKSDTYPSKLPFYYPKAHEKIIKTQENKEIERPPYSVNIPDNSVFSPNYDVESYLRRNLNPTRESLNSNRLSKEKYPKDTETAYYVESDDNRNVIVEKALIHDRPKDIERKNDRPKFDRSEANDRPKYNDPFEVIDHRSVNDRPKFNDRAEVTDRPKFNDRPLVNDRQEILSKEMDLCKEDPLPIPVLRNSPKPRTVSEHERSDLSEAMQVVDDKWKIPVVQKNILKSLPNEEGRNVSILTQLGSIRRQLQLEQLKLDKMLYKDSDV